MSKEKLEFESITYDDLNFLLDEGNPDKSERVVSLFEDEDIDPDTTNDPAVHWRGMPEHVQGNEKRFHSVTVHFIEESDMLEFAALINQTITKSTKSIFHPAKPKKYVMKYRWVELPDD